VTVKGGQNVTTLLVLLVFVVEEGGIEVKFVRQVGGGCQVDKGRNGRGLSVSWGKGLVGTVKQKGL